MDGLISLMNHNYSLPVNLGNPEEHTIGQFAEIIKDLSGEYLLCASAKVSYKNYVAS